MPRGWRKPKNSQPKPKPAKPVEPFKGLYFVRDDYAERYRVGTNKWFGDQFELLTELEFQALQATCKRFGIPLDDKTDD